MSKPVQSVSISMVFNCLWIRAALFILAYMDGPLTIVASASSSSVKRKFIDSRLVAKVSFEAGKPLYDLLIYSLSLAIGKTYLTRLESVRIPVLLNFLLFTKFPIAPPLMLDCMFIF